MTFTTKIKEEITQNSINSLEARCELAALLRYNSKITKNISITLENAAVARRIYKNIKELFKINPKVVVRNQKRFRIKQIYILEINEKINYILEALDITSNGHKIMPNENSLVSQEEKISFLQGTFLACGSISDPATSGYHLEFVFNYKQDAEFILKLLKGLKLSAKSTIRNNKQMVYIKSSEDISDIIKMFKATNSLFYFEDIRIYRDHKNMVNRLNNCEIANQEKTLNTGMKQIDDIIYLKENDIFMLLDEKTQIVANFREKYPESSYQELADIISLETDYKIGKSGINHHFIKMKNLVIKHKEK
ncbi:MAG: DNA-binding protein WhiA [Bacilli bacterium]|nr:DNA-binding protein WhiA [Bacilli bacterium]